MSKQKRVFLLAMTFSVCTAAFLYYNETFTRAPASPILHEEDNRLMTRIDKGTLCKASTLPHLRNPEDVLLMEISTGGCVVIETFPDKAPNHVKRFKELAREHFYDNVVFHRVIAGFMAQTGDPTGTGEGGSGTSIAAEFNDVPHTPGIVSTARTDDPDSADSQFFIMYGTKPHLDGQYTVWGRVVSGMDYVTKLKKGTVEGNGIVSGIRDYIVSLRVAADVLKDKTS